MKHRHQLTERYPDLVGEQADPNLEHIVRDLDAVYSTSDPPEWLAKSRTRKHDLVSQNRERRATAARWLSLTRWTRRPTSAVAAALLVIIVLASGVYATAPQLMRMMQQTLRTMDPAASYVAKHALGQALHRSRTIDGATVTLVRAFADANRIIVFYGIAVRDPRWSDGHWHAGNIELTDNTGRTYRRLFLQE